MARNVIDVSVSRRVLWVGGDAYPLQHIARARQLVWWPPKRSRTIIRFVRQVFGLLCLTTFLGALLKNSADKTQAGAVPGVLLLAGFAFCLYRLVTKLRQRALYKLVIETSNSATTAVVSHDPRQIGSLIQMIMDAIDNPQAEFALQVENVHIGDRINQYGDHNIGKQVGR
ncbi:hypothetical protein BX285_3060 [Streptomyces sp. 1114.5]|uniref:DUF6232 family protein n=1 Tax=unclassified Streptomyces TaxID=2593676 RepID=UPI000BD393AE|nr:MULTISPECIES: DUF6232 family protein [unclassified Streptomyces]RKT18631.1 hypothetical protein BX285_3060 [Streptomyces sp. 1114.5]SOB84833.1 hypothetical protein SAMN06272789_5094 [Streptomyces sp. 1331.2]